MQYSVITTWITCLYGSQPLSVVFGCTAATFGADLQVSMGPRHDLSFCGYKTAWLASEILVSIGPSPHVWFLDAKQRLLDRNNKSLRVPDKSCRFVHAIQRDYHQNYLSLWVPTLICGFWMHNSDFWSRLTSLYGSQTWPVVLWIQNSVISIRNTSLHWSQPSCVVFACITAHFEPEFQVSMGPSPHLRFLHAKQRVLAQN